MSDSTSQAPLFVADPPKPAVLIAVSPLFERQDEVISSLIGATRALEAMAGGPVRPVAHRGEAFRNPARTAQADLRPLVASVDAAILIGREGDERGLNLFASEFQVPTLVVSLWAEVRPPGGGSFEETDEDWRGVPAALDLGDLAEAWFENKAARIFARYQQRISSSDRAAPPTAVLDEIELRWFAEAWRQLGLDEFEAAELLNLGCERKSEQMELQAAGVDTRFSLRSIAGWRHLRTNRPR